MKYKENKKLKDKNNNKIKRQVSIITVFLWIFLVATMVMIIAGNLKNTNALEDNNVEIYEEISKLNNEDTSSNIYINKPAPPTINKIENSSLIKVQFICIGNNNHNEVGGVINDEEIVVGEVIENDGNDEMSPEIYPWICDISLNLDFWINAYNEYTVDGKYCREHFVISSNSTLRLYYVKDSDVWIFKKSDVPLEIRIIEQLTINRILETEKLYINVECSNDYTHNKMYNYLTSDDSLIVKNIIENDGSNENFPIKYFPYIFIVKLNSDYWIEKYNQDLGKEHFIVENSQTLKFYYDTIFGTEFWSYSNDEVSLKIKVIDKPMAPEKSELFSILEKEFVKVHCVNNIHNNRLYNILNSDLEEIEEVSIGESYYLEEKDKILCDVTLNGKEYAKRYSNDTEYHYLVKDENFNEIAVDDEDIQKTITLYYDLENSKWKVLEEMEFPIKFNVKCYIDVELEGYYKVKHEYYLKDKNNNMTLEGTYYLRTTKVAFEEKEEIKVGIPSEEETVDIEIKKKPNYNLNGIEYIYEYYENSGNIIIEEGLIKEITLRYVREEENETKIKAEKIWEDENNKYSKRPENVVLQIKNGEEILAEMEVSEENNWSCEFVVQKYDKAGNEIKYTVDEKETSEFYEKIIDGYIVINKYIGDEEIINKVDVDTSDINIFIYVSVFIISIIGINIVRKNIVNRKID